MDKTYVYKSPEALTVELNACELDIAVAEKQVGRLRDQRDRIKAAMENDALEKHKETGAGVSLRRPTLTADGHVLVFADASSE